MLHNTQSKVLTTFSSGTANVQIILTIVLQEAGQNNVGNVASLAILWHFSDEITETVADV